MSTIQAEASDSGESRTGAGDTGQQDVRTGKSLTVTSGVVLVVLYAALYMVQRRIDATFGNYRATEEILYIEDGELLKKVMVGFENVAADLYWLRTVQYFGGKRLQVTNKDYRLLEPLLNITTTLDPKFKIAYSYGATFLAEPIPMGAGIPLKGIELIERGIDNHPDYWRFYLDKGFIYFWHLQDYEKAAEIFLEGSELPGAPYWMIATAGRTLTRGGDRETARQLWGVLFESAETDQQRENARTHLQQLDALDQLEVLSEIVTRFHSETGSFPEDWQRLVAARYLKEPPRDPAGVTYVLDPRTGGVTLSDVSPLAGLPTR